MKSRLSTLGARLLPASSSPPAGRHEAELAAERERRRLLILRFIVVGCQAATILISWRVWQTRQAPPLLPALAIPSLDMGVPLLVSLLLVLRFPVTGTVVHASLLALSFVMDQTRLQPEVVSMAILLLATSGRRNLMLVGRVHLLTLWSWAGFTKLVSPDFAGIGRWMFEGLPLPSSLDALGAYFGAVVIVLEMGAGVLGVSVRTRRISVAFAFAVHFGALLSLGPLGHNWNRVIWPWNVALPAAALVLIGPWTQTVAAEVRSSGWPMRIVVAVLALYPAGYYVGAVDAYPAHHLYSGDTPVGIVCGQDQECAGNLGTTTLESLNVPLPPEHRLLRALFDRTCRPGETLRILDTRRWYALRGWERRHPCPVEK